MVVDTTAGPIALDVRGLTMTYRTPVRAAGLRAAAASLFRREYRRVDAVRAVSFAAAAGEVVGFLGPNGAGKTTTLKLLSGVLHPTAGEAWVLGHVPWRREDAFLRRIAFVRGSRPLGAPGELTVMDALRFRALLYEVPDAELRRNLGELADLLGLAPLLPRQVRALSLGERMRAGLAHALLYRPRVLFLDEPTLGLDVSAVGLVRRFVADYARETGATVLLTSHYMADVAALCRRVVLIDRGELRYDGTLSGLAARLTPWKLVTVTFVPGGPPGATGAPGPGVVWERFGEVVSAEAGRVCLRVPRARVAETTAWLLTDVRVDDLAVEEPPLERVIDLAYREGPDGAGDSAARPEGPT